MPMLRAHWDPLLWIPLGSPPCPSKVARTQSQESGTVQTATGATHRNVTHVAWTAMRLSWAQRPGVLGGGRRVFTGSKAWQ